MGISEIIPLFVVVCHIRYRQFREYFSILLMQEAHYEDHLLFQVMILYGYRSICIFFSLSTQKETSFLASCLQALIQLVFGNRLYENQVVAGI